MLRKSFTLSLLLAAMLASVSTYALSASDAPAVPPPAHDHGDGDKDGMMGRGMMEHGGHGGMEGMHHMHAMMVHHASTCLYAGEPYSDGALIKVPGTNTSLVCKVTLPPEPTTPAPSAPTNADDAVKMHHHAMPKAQWVIVDGKSK